MSNNDIEPITATATSPGDAAISDAGKRQQIVLFIHGTGSASIQSEYPLDAPREQRWWQRGSPFWHALETRLKTSTVSLPEKGFWASVDELAQKNKLDHFAWSGANSEQDRRLAGERLWKVLKKLQDQMIDVHLIGHSHGGSVIRHAILRSESQKSRRLKNIKSVASVGTPFVGFRPHPWGWMWFFVAALLILLIKLPFAAVATSMWEFTRRPQRPYEWLLSSLFIDIDWWYWVTARWPEAVAQEHNPLTYFPLPICLIFAAVCLLYFLRWSVQWLNILSFRPRLIQAQRRYETIWRSLYSRHDEAINGLILVDRLKLEKITPRFGGWPWSLLYDPIIPPHVDQFFTETTRDAAMGSDCIGEFASWVGKAPFQTNRLTVEPFPDAIEVSLMGCANTVASDTVVRLRQSLTSSARDIGKTFSERALAGMVVDRVLSSTNGELVHNQYFDCAEVQAILAAHILDPTNPLGTAPLKPPIPADRSRYKRLRAMVTLVATLLALCSLASFWFLDQRVNYNRKVIIASKDFDESELVGEILAKKLRLGGYRNAEFHNTDYTSREILQQAAMQEIQVYMEYTGSLYRWLDTQQKSEVDRATLGIRKVDPAAAPRFGLGKDDPRDFKNWFARQRSTNRQLATFSAGSSLGMSSPYVVAMKRNWEGGESLFSTLRRKNVIVPIDPLRQKQWRDDCPGIRMDFQMSFPEFEKWLKDAPAESPAIRFGLTKSLLTKDSGTRRLFSSMNTGPERISLSALDHDEKYAALRNRKVDFVDGYGTDPELFNSQEDSEFCGIAISGLDDEPQRLVGEVLIPYTGFALVSLPRRAQRNAILLALQLPSSSENPTGAINQVAFVAMLKDFRAEVARQVASENQDGKRDKIRREIIDRHWDRLFLPETNSPAP